MKKYKSEEYYSVIDKRTGKKIVDCSSQIDASMMVSFDPNNRVIATNKMLMGQVVDIEMPKQLPTMEIVAVHNVSSENFDEYMDNLLEPKQIKLPEGQGKPIKI